MTAQETIKVILEYLGMTPTEFSKCIGLERAQAIFDMQTGKTKTVSKRMASQIKKAYPAFSEVWLLTGSGEMLETEMPANCFSDRSPQIISKTNMDDALHIIQDLIKQVANKDAIIAELTENNKRLTDAFEKLAVAQGVQSVESKKAI